MSSTQLRTKKNTKILIKKYKNFNKKNIFYLIILYINKYIYCTYIHTYFHVWTTCMYCNFFVCCSFCDVFYINIAAENLLFNFGYLSISLIFNKGLKYLDKRKFCKASSRSAHVACHYCMAKLVKKKSGSDSSSSASWCVLCVLFLIKLLLWSQSKIWKLGWICWWFWHICWSCCF